MAYFNRIKTEKGYVNVEATPPGAIDDIDLTGAGSITLPGGPKGSWKCSLCPKQFTTAGVASMHFAKSHKDIEKARWREYIKQQ